MQYLEIALNVPINQTFTYSDLPDGTEKILLNEKSIQNELIPTKRNKSVKNFKSEIGKRVEVKFGNRRLIGIILKIYDKLPENLPYNKTKIRPIIRVLDEKPILTFELINIGKWMSNYYITPIGEVLSSIIPSGKKETEVSAFSFVEEFPNNKEIILSD